MTFINVQNYLQKLKSQLKSQVNKIIQILNISILGERSKFLCFALIKNITIFPFVDTLYILNKQC